MDLPTLHGLDLPPLGWTPGRADVGRFDKALIEPICYATLTGGRVRGLPHKPGGGLWTAPLCRDEHGRARSTAWTDWCESEDFGQQARIVTEIIPDPAATVYRIDTLADLKSLMHCYPPNEDSPWPRDMAYFAVLDWPTLSLDVDAIWLTGAGEAATRYSAPNLCGWDVETVLWLQPRVSQGELLELSLPPRERG